VPILPPASTLNYGSRNVVSWTTRRITLLPSYRTPLGTPLTPPWAPPAPVNATPLHICNLVTEKSKARSQWQRSRNQGDRIIYNRLKRNLQAALRDARNDTFEKYITSLSLDDTSLWKATKGFKRRQVSIPRSGHQMVAGQRVTSRILRLLEIIFTRCLRRTRLSILTTS
jgi:hypothetical protein